MPRKLLLSLLLTAAVVLASAGTAAAAGLVGTAPIPGQTSFSQSLELGVDGQSNATAFWIDSPDGCNGTSIATRPVGGSWSTDSTLLSSVCANDFAMNDSGAAAIAWTDYQFVGGTTWEYQIWVATRPANGAPWVTPAAPVATVATGYDNLENPSVTVDPSGNVTVVWDHFVSGSSTYQVEYVRGTAAGLFPDPAAAVPSASTSGNYTYPQPVSDAAGDVTVVWQQAAADCSSGTPCLQASRLSGGAWTTDEVAHAPAQGDTIYTPRVTVGSDGQVAAAWRIYSAANANSSIEVGTRLPDGSWDVQPVPSSDSYDVYASQYYPAIAIDPQGGTQVVWAYDENGATLSYGVRAASRPAGQLSWPAGVDDLRAKDVALASASPQAVVFDSNHSAIAVFGDGAGAAMRVRDAGSSTWSASLPLTSDATSPPVAAADPLGDTHVAWFGSAGAGSDVYDAGGPQISNIALDASPIAGLPFGMSVTAHDAWSEPVAIAWTLGDGATATATGGSVTHAYALSGSYSVKATATDALGNSSSTHTFASVGSVPTGPKSGDERPVGGGSLPPPVANQTANAEPVGAGPILVQEPGSDKFVPLTKPDQIRDGAIVDARHGRVRITIDNGHGGVDTADFYEGLFRFTQPKVGKGQTAFANLYLVGGSFKGCAKAPANPKIASAARKRGRKQSSSSVRHLWGSGHGAFRTVGRFASATVRGTNWETDDRCDGTLTKVKDGKVGVRDFVLGKTIVVKKGGTYFAKPKKH